MEFNGVGAGHTHVHARTRMHTQVHTHAYHGISSSLLSLCLSLCLCSPRGPALCQRGRAEGSAVLVCPPRSSGKMGTKAHGLWTSFSQQYPQEVPGGQPEGAAIIPELGLSPGGPHKTPSAPSAHFVSS